MKVTAVGLRKSAGELCGLIVSDLRYRPCAPTDSKTAESGPGKAAFWHSAVSDSPGYYCLMPVNSLLSSGVAGFHRHGARSQRHLARHRKFHLLLNFSNRDGSKAGVTQLLVEFCQSCLLESGPLCDACLYLLA